MLDAVFSVLSGSAASDLEAAVLCLKIITAVSAAICLIATFAKISARLRKKPALSGGVLFLAYAALIISLAVTVLAGRLAEKARDVPVFVPVETEEIGRAHV